MRRALLLVGALAALAGCGGGSDPDPTSTPGPRPDATPRDAIVAASGTSLTPGTFVESADPIDLPDSLTVASARLQYPPPDGLTSEPLRVRDGGDGMTSRSRVEERRTAVRDGDRPLEGTTIGDRPQQVVTRLRARTLGAYFVGGVLVTGTDGSRALVGGSHCYVVTPKPVSCSPSDDLPDDAEVAAVGVSHRSGAAARMTETDGGLDVALTLAPGRHQVAIPVANLGDEPLRLEEARIASLQDGSASLRFRPLRPTILPLDPRAVGVLRVTAIVDGCAKAGGEVDTLQATVGGVSAAIPLAAPIRLGC